MRYIVFKDNRNEWRWHLEGGNNRIIACSGQGYEHKSDCISAINLVKGSTYAPVYER